MYIYICIYTYVYIYIVLCLCQKDGYAYDGVVAMLQKQNTFIAVLFRVETSPLLNSRNSHAFWISSSQHHDQEWIQQKRSHFHSSKSKWWFPEMGIPRN